MLYIAYLDEFGHIGPYISHDDRSHKTHPAFGLAGIVLPANAVREFSTFFFQIKNNMLKFEIDKSGLHPAKWEKKGASLYTTKNVQKYRQVRSNTNRILSKINSLGGYVIYVGTEKRRELESHDSKSLYHCSLREMIKRINDECSAKGDQFIMILDQQEDHKMRPEIVEQAALSMYSDGRKCLIEPPIQVESHLYQTIQCADWICGIVGRLSQYECDPVGFSNFDWAEKYFGDRIRRAQKRSGIRRLPKPPTQDKLESLLCKFNQ